MKKWLLPLIVYYKNLDIQKNTFIPPKRLLKKDEIILYNKNAMKYTFWKVIKNHPTKDALILGRGNIPYYWRNVIIPFDN